MPAQRRAVTVEGHHERSTAPDPDARDGAACRRSRGDRAVRGVLLPLGASASQTTAAQASQGGSPRLGHVFIIMLENHAADHVIGDPNAPFITSLARKYVTNYGVRPV